MIVNYEPDFGALRNGPAQVVVGVGGESTAGQLAYRSALALAAELGCAPVTFPGDHAALPPTRKPSRPGSTKS
jgi:hypothetical protein